MALFFAFFCFLSLFRYCGVKVTFFPFYLFWFCFVLSLWSGYLQPHFRSFIASVFYARQSFVLFCFAFSGRCLPTLSLLVAVLFLHLSDPWLWGFHMIVPYSPLPSLAPVIA